MPDPSLVEILQYLQSTRFGDVAGARVSATVPVSETLLNRIVAATMPANLPVRAVSVRPEPGNRFSVRLTPRASLLPPVTLKLEIDRQPEFPTSPVLVLRMATLSGLFGIAGAALPMDRLLPPGVRLDGERILVDLRLMAARHGLADYLQFVRTLTVTTEAGRLVIHTEAAVAAA